MGGVLLTQHDVNTMQYSKRIMIISCANPTVSECCVICYKETRSVLYVTLSMCARVCHYLRFEVTQIPTVYSALEATRFGHSIELLTASLQCPMPHTILIQCHELRTPPQQWLMRF
jgi:hypothetical protein